MIQCLYDYEKHGKQATHDHTEHIILAETPWMDGLFTLDMLVVLAEIYMECYLLGVVANKYEEHRLLLRLWLKERELCVGGPAFFAGHCVFFCGLCEKIFTHILV